MSSPKIQGLTADVEVLTQVEGWKSIASVGETEKIATKPFGGSNCNYRAKSIISCDN